MTSYIRNLHRYVNSPTGSLIWTNQWKGITTPRYLFTSKNKFSLNSDYLRNSTNWKNNSLRTYSTPQNHSIPVASGVTASTSDEIRAIMAVFPDIVQDLTEFANKYSPAEISAWFARSLEYNVPSGKKNRALITVLAYKNLVKPQDLTPENIRLAHILGWCVEILNSFFLVYDDIMDNSFTRRGQTCWYKVDDVGIIAINDALMMENGVYVLLKKYFRKLDCYLDLVELFHEITFMAACGQSFDMLNSNSAVSSFTMEKYNAMAANKTAYNAFYFPFALAMHLSGIKDQNTFVQSKPILLEMGRFFQIQDDFLDCFGNPQIIGKFGTDIQNNKCSWLAVVCMQRANDDQKQIMQECYGKNEPEKVQRVKELYETLGLHKIYADFEEETYNMIKTNIQQSLSGVPHGIFLQILNKMYRRLS